MLPAKRSSFDIANILFVCIYGLGLLTLLVGFLPRHPVPFVDTFLVLSLAPVFNNSTLGLLLIVPTAFFVAGYFGKSERAASFRIASAYLFFYIAWLLLPGGTRILDDGALAFSKNPLYFIGALAIPTIYHLLMTVIYSKHRRTILGPSRCT